ncbi:uncharacterized protein [Henckelia pumila]|uniref:uncharacterized protein n=1 Tax=Henckelia pumila TaxID=405737 RepID=UPI003C6EA040
MGPKPLVGGESPEDAGNWLWRMEVCFWEFRYTEEQRMETLDFLAKASELLGLRQVSMSINEYQLKFFELLPYCPQIADSKEAKYNLFLQGLNPEINELFAVGDDMTYERLDMEILCDLAGIIRGHADIVVGIILPIGAESHVFSLRHDQEVDENEKVIAGTFLLFDIPAFALIDTSASHSFIFARFVKKNVDNIPSFSGLLPELIRFHPVGDDSWFFCGEGERPQMPLLSALKVCRALESGAEGYLIYAVDTSAGSVIIESIPVLNEFLDVFPDEIPGFPLVREVEFGIDLMPGTSPISRAPYQLALLEMRELKLQLQDLLNKGYIRPRYFGLLED